MDIVNEEFPDATISPFFDTAIWIVVVVVVAAAPTTAVADATLPVPGPSIFFVAAVAFAVAVLKDAALAAKIISNASFSVCERCLSAKPSRLRASIASRQASIAGPAVAGNCPGNAAATGAGAGAAGARPAGARPAGARPAVAGGKLTCTAEQVLPVTLTALTQSASCRFSALSHLSPAVHGLQVDGTS